MQPSRSVYLERFKSVADFAFADGDAPGRRGRWREFFGPRVGPAFDGRVILEIGCFDVGFLAAIAAKHPRTAFVGLDWKCKPLLDGAQRIAELGLSNVALLRARAQDLPALFAPRELDEIWVFHPDPCSQEKELKNRLIAEPFLLAVHEALRGPTSSLTLKTDHPGYYQWVLGLLGLPQPFLHPPSASPDAGASAQAPRLRAGDLMPWDQVPKPSQAVRERFEVTMDSADFWHDPVAQAHCAGRCFAAMATLFESRFVKKRQPIYACELRKR